MPAVWTAWAYSDPPFGNGPSSMSSSPAPTTNDMNAEISSRATRTLVASPNSASSVIFLNVLVSVHRDAASASASPPPASLAEPSGAESGPVSASVPGPASPSGLLASGPAGLSELPANEPQAP